MPICDLLKDAQTPESFAPAGTKSYKEMLRKDISACVTVQRKMLGGWVEVRILTDGGESEQGKKQPKESSKNPHE